MSVDFAHNLFASAVSGAAGMAMFNPLDCLRVRWQVARADAARARTAWRFAAEIARREGLVAGLWRPGLALNTAGVALCNGVRFAAYPVIRDALSLRDTKSGGSMLAGSLLAGAVAYAVSAPLYLAKTRAQGLTGLVDRSTGRYATGPHAGQPPACASLARALRAGGVAALWTGAGVLVARGAALTGGQLTAYDATKTGLKARGALREGPALHLVASVHGALWATTLAMPLDNLMARYQAEPGRYRGPWRCAAELVRAEGPAVLMRGWGPMFVRLAPMHVVNATLFEQVRFLVGGGYYE